MDQSSPRYSPPETPRDFGLFIDGTLVPTGVGGVGEYDRIKSVPIETSKRDPWAS